MIEVAGRLHGIGEYYFATKLREIDVLNKAGHSVINLGIGSPDLPPHPTVIETLHQEAAKQHNHAYQSYKGSPVLRHAISEWYKNNYDVAVDPETEVLPLIGSKEGIMHICMTYLDKGDAALVPNPGYPTYSAAVKLSGGEVLSYELRAENHWHPVVEELKTLLDAHQSNGSRIKLLFLNYPHMPTGQAPDATRLQSLIEFAKEHDIVIIHDNPYSFILNDHPFSLLSLDQEKNTVIELNSLSKSHNMAGWRVGMIVASQKHVNNIMRFKSNMDSGMFLPVQLAAAKALTLDASWYAEVNKIYAERKLLACKLLDAVECIYDKSQVGMFIWAKIPSSYANGYALSDALLNQSKVFITPGGIFGTAGDAYVRVSLCSKKELLQEAIGRIQKMH
ncbi:MAG: aminotransferase class I/II-fold pyridoxal phosphate-dependent enzyme [Bacteroidetes bacterium]|nr:aminotransferase class I/II-fold pyridoxal phosphate-dependent enzyme [Bacteroidota bacterium]